MSDTPQYLCEQHLYQLAVCHTTDIRALAAMMDMTYQDTEKALAVMIGQAVGSSAKGMWKAFRGAHIDKQKRQIVLRGPTDRLVTANVMINAATGFFACGIVSLLLELLFVVWMFRTGALREAWVEGALMTLLVVAMPMGISVLLLIIARNLRLMKQYVGLLDEGKSVLIRELAMVSRRSVVFVRRDVQRRIEAAMMINARYDERGDKIVIIERTPPDAPRSFARKPLPCPACGAKPAIALSLAGKRYMKEKKGIVFILMTFGSVCCAIALAGAAFGIWALRSWGMLDALVDLFALLAVVMLLGITTFAMGAKMRRRQNRCRAYMPLITEQQLFTAAEIARAGGQAVNTVREDLDKWINHKFPNVNVQVFEDVQFDVKTDTLVFAPQSKRGLCACCAAEA